MTSFCGDTTSRLAGFVRTDIGRGDGAGTERMKRRRFFWCRRFAGLLAIAALGGTGCKRTAPSRNRDAGVPRLTIDAGPPFRVPAKVRQDTTSNPAEQQYYEGYFAETLHGKFEVARAAYRQVMSMAGKAQPELAARAALRLASLESLAGRRREALELVARASVLGRTDPVIVEAADRMQTHLASIRARGSEVRGPPAGTRLPGASKQANQRFAAAEAALAFYHRMQLQPRLEALRASVGAKEHAMENAVRAYRKVIALNEPAATAPAEFRIASLRQDLAVSLMFDLPPELEPQAAARLRRALRASALSNLRQARTAYRRSLAAANQDKSVVTTRWRLAAEGGLRSVEDLLGIRE